MVTGDRAMPARRKARKRALDVLYEADLRADDVRETLARRLEQRDPPIAEYTIVLVQGFAGRAAEIDELISQFAQEWTLSRMPPVDRNILRLATYELRYGEVDAAVAISEAVELAKSLSTDESPRFINGVLGRIAAMPPAAPAE